MAATANTITGGGASGKNRPLLHTATANPTVDNDSAHGCLVGDTWINTVTPKVFILTSSAVGAAVWKEVTLV